MWGTGVCARDDDKWTKFSKLKVPHYERRTFACVAPIMQEKEGGKVAKFGVEQPSKEKAFVIWRCYPEPVLGEN